MKTKVTIIATAAILSCIVLIVAIAIVGGSREVAFDVDEWSTLNQDKREARIEDVFRSGMLPEGEELKFISWLMVTEPALAEKLVGQYGHGIEELPWFLSDTALQLIKVRNLDTGFKILQLAQKTFPRNPDVLGISGIVAYLSGEREDAKKLLEEADSWRQNKPIVDFYLGGLLITSSKAADLTRGKIILLSLLEGDDPELRQLSGLALLTNLKVPMIREDISAIFTTLDEAGVFTANNPNVTAVALRIIINRMASGFPEQSLKLADLLTEKEEATIEDFIGAARLAQALGQPSFARKAIDAMEARPDLSEELESDKRYKRIVATQYFLENNNDAGLQMIEELVQDEASDVVVLQETFQSILKGIDSLDTERKLLNYYLELPVQNIQASLDVLARLIQIEPLKEESRVQYAIDELFPKEPLRVGDWLIQYGASQQLIEAVLKDGREMNADVSLVLVNAYLKIEDAASAQSALDSTINLMDPMVADYLQARISAMTGNVEEAVIHWENAQQEVMGSSQFLMMKSLGFLALELEQPVNALQSLYMAMNAGMPFTRNQAGQLLELTLSFGTLRQSIRVAEYLANLEPGEVLHKNNLAYFKFLAEESVEESVETMRKLVEDYPDIPQFKLTLALGLVKAGRKNEASRLLQSTDIEWSDTSPRGLLIYVVVLAATGQNTLAEGLMQNLDQSPLIPEEKALLEEF